MHEFGGTKPGSNLLMFVNYFGTRARDSPINLAVGRLILGTYLIWKTIWYDWSQIVQSPFSLIEAYSFAVPYGFPLVLTIEKWVLIATLLAFIVGYRLGTTAFVSAVLLAHLAIVRFTLNISGGTTALFLGVYSLIFFGIYRHQDELSLDAFRRTGGESTAKLRRHLTSPAQESYRMDALKWSLLAVAIIYFGAGYFKLLRGGLGWASAENLSRILLVRGRIYEPLLPIDMIVLDYPTLVGVAAWGTLILELGFVFAVLARGPITPFVLGIAGMQAGIALVIGPFFFDVYPLFALFFPWDSVYGHIVRDRNTDVVSNERRWPLR